MWSKAASVVYTLFGVGKGGKANYTVVYVLGSVILNTCDVISPSDNADMSNEKGITPRLKLMVLFVK